MMNILNRIKLITYNVCGKSAHQTKADDLFNFVQLRKFNLIFIGLQEVSNDSSWTALLKKRFGEHNYVMVKVRNIWAIWLYAFVKRSRLLQIDNVESEVTASGYGGVMGNKGGVSIRFRYHGVSLIVVNAHFTAHEDGFKDRLNDYLDILTNQQFRDPDVSNILDHDLVFWIGDLNFRIESMSKEEIENYVKNKNYSILIENDQLLKAIEQHQIFTDFKEGQLNFPPTYKYDSNSDCYDTSKKKRKPSWTDRILYMYHTDDATLNQSIELVKYYCEQNIRGSDHRAVCGEFKISFNSPAHNLRLPIQFEDIANAWNNSSDQTVEYRLTANVLNDDTYDSNNSGAFKADYWDWIALLPSNWVILTQDLITYIYVTCISEEGLSSKVTVKFQKRFLKSIPPSTSLQLVYFSKLKNCIQGISNVFSFE